jgi:hypothetical protein
MNIQAPHCSVLQAFYHISAAKNHYFIKNRVQLANESDFAILSFEDFFHIIIYLF